MQPRLNDSIFNALTYNYVQQEGYSCELVFYQKHDIIPMEDHALMADAYA